METVIRLSGYNPAADGVTDDTLAFNRCFSDAYQKKIDTVIVEPGKYLIEGVIPVKLFSNTNVFAHGAVFMFPQVLEEAARRVMFSGCDIENFTWNGGCFSGNIFRPDCVNETWFPNANTRCIHLYSSESGGVGDVSFIGITGRNIAGAVIHVEGVCRDERTPDIFAGPVTVRDCVFENCGKFMWDYGFLWQRLVFPDLHTPSEQELVRKFMPRDLYFGPIGMKDGSDTITAEFIDYPDCVQPEYIVFFGRDLPKNIRKGKRYRVVEETSNTIRIADHSNMPIVFEGSGEDVFAIRRPWSAYYGLYEPVNSGPGKGGVDLQVCRDVIVTGCRMSASGDAMHIKLSHNIVFSSNRITGARMGAFFLAEYCKNATISGNTVNGTNGSRILSIERSCEDIIVSGNTFRGGGRGSWINQPKNLILSDNIFCENTTKGESNPEKGRIGMEEGTYEPFPEIYFTTWEPGANYGPVIMRNNIITTGNGSNFAIMFQKGGKDILMEGNVFLGQTKDVVVEEGCETPYASGNTGVNIIRNQNKGNLKFEMGLQ